MARGSAPTTQRAPSRAGPLALPTVLAAALGTRLWLAAANSGLTMDSPLYVRMAEDLLAGRRGPSPAHHGYAGLVALASLLIPGRELPGRVVSLAASMATVLLVWGIARRRAGIVGALVASSLVALHPLLAVYGGAIMTESTFLCIALAGVALLDRGRHRSGGALLGAAWWVRPEALVVAPVAALLGPGRWRERALALGLAACVALPYMGVLRLEQGYWSVSPKTVLVRAPFASERSAEWRLTDSTAFADTASLGERLARDGGAIARAYPSRLEEQARALFHVWPLPLLALSALGLLVPGGRGPWLGLLVLPLAYPLASAPADARLAQLAVPALAVALAAGSSWAFAQGLPVRIAAAATLILGALAMWVGGMGERAVAFDDGPMPAMRTAGSWIAEHSTPDAVVMDRKSFVPFFAGRRHVQLPDEPLDTLLAYARASGATHLVVEEYVVRSLRPQLAPLLDARRLAREPRVRLVFATRPAPGEGVAVLEIRR